MANYGVTGGNAGASDTALAAAGTDNAAIAKDGIAVGPNADLVLGGVNLGGANTGTITVNSGAGVEKVAEQFTQTLNALADKPTNDPAKEAEAASADSASWRKVIVYAAVGLGLILVATFFRKR